MAKTNGRPPRPTPQPKPRRSFFQGLVYWGTVLGVWGLIFIVAFFAVFATDLPDTSKLYDVKRQPSISYLDRSGALVAVRGSQYAPPVGSTAMADRPASTSPITPACSPRNSAWPNTRRRVSLALSREAVTATLWQGAVESPKSQRAII